MKYTKAYTPPMVETLELLSESTMTEQSFNPNNNTELFGSDFEVNL